MLNDQGEEIFRNRIETPINNYQQSVQAISNLIQKTEAKLESSCSIGICTPGSISPTTGLLRNSNSVALNNQPFKQDLEKSLNREIRISNDANCFVLSEATDGAAHDAKIVFGVIMGTGVGAGIVIDKKVLTGKNLIAGEWGHNPLPWCEEESNVRNQCWCGQVNCIETFLSGPGFQNEYFHASRKQLSAKEIIELANAGNEIALNTLHNYQHRLARSLAHIINILDPDKIVLGGGMSNIEQLYKNVPDLWKQWIFSDVIATELVAPEFGDSSGVRGAAWLWND